MCGASKATQPVHKQCFVPCCKCFLQLTQRALPLTVVVLSPPRDSTLTLMTRTSGLFCATRLQGQSTRA